MVSDAREMTPEIAREASSAGSDEEVTWTPRGAAIWSLAAYSLAACLLGYPVFHGGFLVSPHSDQYIGGYAVREFGTAMIRSGHLPLWNPYLFGGMPFIGAFDGDIFYPPTLLLRLLLRTDLAVTWAFILHVILAGWFTYLWLRASGLGFAAAGIGGLAYELGGPIASFVSPGHDGKLYVSALLPLALCCILLGVRDGKRWCWPALALTVGCAALAPHPQIFEYFLLTAGAYAIFVATPLWPRAPAGAPATRAARIVRVARSVPGQRLGAALAAVALGLMMSAVQFLPVAQFVAWSPRGSRSTGAGTYSYATQFSMPFEDLPNVYLPQFSGMLEHYWGGLGSHWFSEYLGASVLVLAGAGLVAATAGRRRIVRFWLAAAIVATLWSLGRYTPFYHLVYALVPGTPFFRVPAAAFVIVGLAVAALAGEGVACVLRRGVRVRYVIAWIGLAGVLAIPAVIHGVAHAAAHVFGAPWTPGAADANAGPVAMGALRCLVVVVLMGAILAIRRDDKLSARAAAATIALVVAADLWSIARAYWFFSPPAARMYASDPAIDTLRAQTEPVRVLAWPLGHPHIRADPEIAGDGLMIHRIRQVLGYHGNGIKRYDDLSWTTDGTQPLFTPHFWQLLNVGFLLTDTAKLSFEGATRIVGPVPDAAGDTLYLYRLAGEHPAAWLTAAARSLPDTFARLGVINQHFDLRRLALLEMAAHATAPDSIGPAPAEQVIADRYEPGDLHFHLSAPAPPGTTLIVSENFYPGWHATADDTPVPVWRADYALIGIPLPAGTRTVELTFTSRTVKTGLLLSILAALSAIAWLAGASRQSRRKSRE
jgi:Bacterial membrane protein YfhO